MLQDSRITKEDHEESCFYWNSLVGLGPRFDSPPLSAAVSLLSEGGEAVDTLRLDHPIARIDTWKVYSDARVTYAVTVNDSICIGTWRGPIITPLEVRGGRLKKVLAADPGGKDGRAIELRVGMRGDMRLVDARSGAGKDILYVRSGFVRLPSDDHTGSPFATTFTRFSFEGGRWVRRQRVERGDWQNSGEGFCSFLARASFP